MRIRIALTSIIVTLLSLSSAFAARIEEVVRPQGLLLLGDFRQWAALAYEYSGHDSNASSSGTSTNHFMEKYHLNFDAAIIDPRLLNIQLDSDIWLDQARSANETSGSQSSKSFRYRYSFAGAAFDRKPYPINIISSRGLDTIVTPFVPSYTTDSMQNGISVVLLNNIVPLRFQYLKTSVETNGLRQDYSSASDNLNLRANHNFRDISQTEVSASASSQHQNTGGLKPTDSRNYGFSLTNSLILDRENRYSLASGFTMQNAKSGDIPQESLNWAETLTARFGKALEGKLSNWYNYNKTTGFDNREQVFKTNTVSGALSHRLAESIESRFAGSFRQAELLGGHETGYNGSAGLTYSKKLPAASNLLLNVTRVHEVTDRNIVASQLIIRDEPHTVAQQGDSFTLDVAGTIIDVTSVKSLNPDDPPFFEGPDYGVNLGLRLIDIVVGGNILPGTNLLITYVVQTNTSTIKYTTDTLSTSGSLSLFQNRYRLSVSLTESDQNLISGQSANANLNSTRRNLVQLDANYPSNTFNLEYSNFVSNAANFSYFEGGWRFDRRFPFGGVTLKARDRYTINEPTATSRGHSENTAELGSSYSKSLTSWAQLMLSANYVNTRGDNISRDYAYFRMNLQGRFNKAALNLSGQTILRISPTETLRDDYVRLELTRYF